MSMQLQFVIGSLYVCIKRIANKAIHGYFPASKVSPWRTDSLLNELLHHLGGNEGS